ncbi:PREDICTED: calmodulin-binding transcription activator 1-like, partial [Acanthisitta chloris]|uniref:calmodulin-binding transcription activator 1-like n=1 Tax=Acanthisitta chloris TaxID=57068 RepID=UPI0004F0EF36
LIWSIDTPFVDALILSVVMERPPRRRCLRPLQADDHGNSNGSHVKIFLPKKLLECLPKCSSLPKERHRWNTNE